MLPSCVLMAIESRSTEFNRYIKTYTEANQRYTASLSFPPVLKITSKDKESSGNV